MPRYQITAPDGRVVTVEGDTAPTDADAEQIFASLPPKNPSPETDGEIKAYNPSLIDRVSGLNDQIKGTAYAAGRAIRNSGPVEAVLGRSASAPAHVIDKSSVGDRLAGAAVDAGLEGGGATAGQAAGTLGGPLAPITVPVGGAIGGVIGDYLAQKRRMAKGEQNGYKIGQGVVSGLTGLIPGSGLFKSGKTLVRAAEGAGTAVLGNNIATAIDEHRVPSVGEDVMTAGIGGTAGAIAGKLQGEAPVPTAADIKPDMREAILARQRLQDAHGVNIPTSMSESVPAAAPFEGLAARGAGGGAVRRVAEGQETALNKIQQDLTDGTQTPDQIGGQLRGIMDRSGQAQTALETAQKVSPELQNQLKQQIASRTAGVSASDPNIGSQSLTSVADDVGAKVQGFVDAAKEQAKQDFGEFTQALADAGLNDRFVKLSQSGKVAQGILNNLPKVEGETAEGFGGQALAKLNGIVAMASEPQSIEQAMGAKAIIGQALANPQSDLGQGVATGQLKQLYKSLTADIDAAVENAPGAKDLLKKAVSNYKNNIEQFQLWGIDQANVAAGDKPKNIVQNILGELKSSGESQLYTNVQKIIGANGTQQLDSALKNEIAHAAINKANQTYNVDQYLNMVQGIRRRSPELADKLGLPSKDTLLDATMALKSVNGSNDISLSVLQDQMQQPGVAAMFKSGELDKAITILKTAQAARDSISRDILSSTLEKSGFNMKQLPDGQTIYRTLMRDPSVPASRVAGYIKAFERKAASSDVDAPEAANLLEGIRKTEIDNLFSSVSKEAAFNPAAAENMARQDAGDVTRTLNPARLRSVILNPGNEADKTMQQKLQAVLGERFQTLRDMALAVGPMQRSQGLAGQGIPPGTMQDLKSAKTSFLQWAGGTALNMSFVSKLLASQKYPAYLTGKGQARRFFQSGSAVSTLTRQALQQGTVENQALIGALEDNGMIGPNGALTPDGQAAIDQFRSN